MRHQIAKIAEFYAGPAISDGPIGPDDFPADSFFPMGFRYDGGSQPGASDGARDSGPYRAALARSRSPDSSLIIGPRSIETSTATCNARFSPECSVRTREVAVRDVVHVVPSGLSG